MKNFFKFAHISLLLISILALIYVSLFDYSHNDDLKKILILIAIIFILLSIFFLNENKRTQLRVSLFFTVISLLFVEIITYKFFEPKLVNYNNISLDFKNEQKELNSNFFDYRTKKEYFDYHKNNVNKNVVISLHPSLYFKMNELEIFPLGGIKDRETIHCNENGYFSIYESDKYGFNNSNKIWGKVKKPYLLLGDSFVQGSCVNESNTISGFLNKMDLATINLGWNGSGPLIQYAILKEFFPKKGIKKIFWFFYENDFYDLERELNNKNLVKYVVNEKFVQNLKNNKMSDKIKIQIFNSKINAYKRDKQSLNQSEQHFKKNFFIYIVNTDIFKIIKFYHLRNLIQKLSIYKEYENIVKKVKVFSIKKNTELFIVYIPSFHTALKKKNNNNFYEKKLQKITKKQQINFINTNEIFFKKIPKEDTVKYFSPKYVHYNEIGYKKIADIIANQTKN